MHADWPPPPYCIMVRRSRLVTCPKPADGQAKRPCRVRRFTCNKVKAKHTRRRSKIDRGQSRWRTWERSEAFSAASARLRSCSCSATRRTSAHLSSACEAPQWQTLTADTLAHRVWSATATGLRSFTKQCPTFPCACHDCAADMLCTLCPMARITEEVVGFVNIHFDAHLPCRMLGVSHREVGVLLHLPRHFHDPRLSPVVLQQLVMPLLQRSGVSLYNRVTIPATSIGKTARCICRITLQRIVVWSLMIRMRSQWSLCSINEAASQSIASASCKPAGDAGRTPPWRGRPSAPSPSA